MELMKGYKQTELGVIPKEWHIKTIHSISIDMLQGVNTAIDIPEYVNDGVPMLKANNIIDGTVNFSTSDHISTKTFLKYSDRFKLRKFDFLFSNIGARLGTGSLLKSAIDCTFAWNVMRITPNQKVINPAYLEHIMNSKIMNNQIMNNISGSGMGFVPKNVLKNLKIPLPPNDTEQTAIATALSDIDELISQTEKLIEKKKAIKQGVMQELLRPKDGWVTKRISEVCWFQEGPGVRKHQFTQSGVKLLNGTNIQEGKLDLENTDKFISEDEAFGWYSHFLVDENDILIACSGVSIDKFHEKVTVAKVFHLPLCMNTSTMRFKEKKGYLDQGYFIQFLKSKRFKEQISGKATGSAQLNFGPSHVTMVEIDLPSIEIQNKIGQVLSDMEMEIENFELKLKKLIFQKQGMMQALLTGKIRLV